MLFYPFLAGCSALIIQNPIPKPEPLTMAQYTQKPNVFIKVRALHGTPTMVRTARPIWDNYVKSRVASVVNESQLFNYFTFNEDEGINTVGSVFGRSDDKRFEKKIDYRIEIAYFEEIDYDQVGWSTVKSTFTLGLIPFYHDQYVMVTMKVFDNNDGKELDAEQSKMVNAKTWKGIWFIPLHFIYTDRDLDKQVDYQIETLLYKAVREGVFKYKL